MCFGLLVEDTVSTFLIKVYLHERAGQSDTALVAVFIAVQFFHPVLMDFTDQCIESIFNTLSCFRRGLNKGDTITSCQLLSLLGVYSPGW